MTKPCVKCGATDRYANGSCRPCQKITGAAYRKANAEKVRATIKEWAVRNADKVKQRSAEWHATNKERRNATQRERDRVRYWEDPERARERIKKQRLKDPEKARAKERAYHATRAAKAYASTKAWIKKNPDYLRQRNADIKAKRRAVEGKLSRGYIKKLYLQQSGLCAHCGASLEHGQHLDHIMPVALGGTHTDDNVQLLCPRCNLKKGALHPEEFKRRSATAACLSQANTKTESEKDHGKSTI